jgi:hypothetical protein
MPATAGGIAMNCEGDVIHALVIEDLVFEGIAGVEQSRQGDVPEPVLPAALTADRDVGARALVGSQQSPRDRVAFLPIRVRIERHRLLLGQIVDVVETQSAAVHIVPGQCPEADLIGIEHHARPVIVTVPVGGPAAPAAIAETGLRPRTGRPTC